MINYFKSLARRGWRMFFSLAKVMLPVMVLVEVGQALGLVQAIGAWIAPAMALLHLPPEAGLIWATTALVGIYGGVGTMAALSGSLELTTAQLSALSAMMLFSHALPIEQSIVRRAGASFWFTTGLRLGCAVLYGAAIAWVCHLTGTLSEPVSLTWLRGEQAADLAGTGVLASARGIAFSLMLTLGIILALVVLLDVCDRLGLTRRFTRVIAPLLKLSGLDDRVAPVTTVGVLLGLTYGGALIIEEAEKQQFSARTRLLALSWLSLTHSLIEDTLIFLALGADLWVILAGRVLLTLIVVGLIARLTRHWEPAGVPAGAPG